jgi:hypothetical protein
MQPYQLKLLQKAGSIHDDFHISLLELNVSDGGTVPVAPPPIVIDGKEEYKIMKILQREYMYDTLC